MKRIFLFFFLTIVAVAGLWADDFSLMRERLLRQIVLGDPASPALALPENAEAMRTYCTLTENEAESARRTLLRDTTFLFSNLPYLSGNRSFTPAHVCESYRRLMLMARAYSWPGCAQYHNADLLADIRFGLSFLYNHAYSERTRMIGNWWEWRIGIPWYYAYTVSMLYDELTPEELSAFERSTSAFTYSFARNGDLTYANQASVCRNLLFIGILTGNDTYVRTALQSAIPAFSDASTPAQRMTAVHRQDALIRRQRANARVASLVHKEGLYSDGTFIQHSSVPYIGSYGTELIAMASYMAVLLYDTQYEMPVEIRKSLPLWIDDAYLPAIWQGQMMLMFMGRSVDADLYANAREVQFSILRAASLLPRSGGYETLPDIASLARSFVYPTEKTASYESFGADLPIRLTFKEEIRDLASMGRAVVPFSRVYAAGDRAIHQTSDWRFGLSMSSNRIAKYECFIRPTARQNTMGWYQGDGMTYLYLPQDEEQYRNYFSTANPYRLAGTTVAVGSREEEQAVQPLYAMPSAAADEARAGGVSLDDCSSAMMQLVGAKSDLRAKKSWFMLPREVVCLGADITSAEEREVLTVVENRRNNTNLSAWPVDGTFRRVRAAADRSLGPTRLTYLDGVGAYWFPDSAELTANFTEEGATELFLDHGISPSSASYSYVLLPLMSESDAMLYSRQPDVRILSNTPKLQAVRHFGLNLTAANFWSAASLKDEGFLSVHSDGMASLMMREQGNLLTLIVADPSWDRSSMQLIIDGLYDLVSANDSNIRISTRAGRYTVIDIDSRNALGRPFKMQFDKN